MNNIFSPLERKARGYMSDARWQHTLGVRDAALRIGEIMLPEQLDTLYVAAVLHDVAKELPSEDQYALIKAYGIDLSDEDLNTRPAIHSFAGAALIRRDFPDFAAEDVISAVHNHTLGSPDMSMIDKIIFLADYIEEGRTAASCIKVRSYVFDNLSQGNCTHNIRVINTAVVMAIDYTAEYLRSNNREINSKSRDTKMSLLPLI